MPFDLRHVESFVAVAETLSFSIAAERTNTVQSAVSSHIKLLERQANRSLVKRGRGRPVALTAEGAAFLVQARRMLMLADQMIHQSGNATDAEPIRLGTTMTFALSVVPSALSSFASQTDAIPVTVRTARSHELMELLEGGQIDVALVFDQGAKPMLRTTLEIGLVWVAAEGFDLSPNAALPLAFLDDARDLRRHAFGALDETGATTPSLSTHPDPIGLRAVILAGLAVTVLPKVSIATPLTDVGARLGLPALGTMPVSVYCRSGYGDGVLKRFTQVLKTKLRAE